MNAEKKIQLWTKAASKQGLQFRGTLSTRVNRFMQWLCGAKEGKADELQDSDNDQSLSKDKEHVKSSSAPFCLRKSVRTRTGSPTACVSNGVTRYTPVSTDNFLFPMWANRKKKCVIS